MNKSDLIIIVTLIYLIYHLIINYKNIKQTILSFCYERYKTGYINNKKKYLKRMDIFLMYREYYHYFKKRILNIFVMLLWNLPGLRIQKHIIIF